jgi:hypothetical protein
VNKQQLEEEAATLGWSFQQGTKKGAGYNLITDEGEMPLGDDYTGSLAAIKQLVQKEQQRRDKALLDDPDEEVEEEEINEDGGISNPKPKEAKARGLSPQEIASSIRDHENAGTIKDVMKTTPDYDREYDRLIRSFDNLLTVVNKPAAYAAFLKLPKHLQAQHWERLRIVSDQYEKAKAARFPKGSKTIQELLLEEKARQANVYIKAHWHVLINPDGLHDRNENTSDQDLNKFLDGEKRRRDNFERNFAPDKNMPDYATPTVGSAPIVEKTKRKLTLAEITSRKVEVKQQDQATRLEEITAALAGVRKPDGRLLKEAKAILEQQGVGFYKWIATVGISETTARRQMKAA